MTPSDKRPQPPTLKATASSGLLHDFGNCGTTRQDGALAYQACRASPGDWPIWIYRIQGWEQNDEKIEATIVSLTSFPLTLDEADFEEDSSHAIETYAPAATYEGGRIFFAGSRDSARRLLDAFEAVAFTNRQLAEALQDDDDCGSGLEAVLFEWPDHDVAVVTLCNTNHSEERRLAVEAVLRKTEARFPGSVSDMESRSDNDYTFLTHEIWSDEVSDTGSAPSERAILAIYDQSERARSEYEEALAKGEESQSDFKNLARALHRREIELATSQPPPFAPAGGKPRV